MWIILDSEHFGNKNRKLNFIYKQVPQYELELYVDFTLLVQHIKKAAELWFWMSLVVK